MTQVNDALHDSDDLDNAAWEKALSDPSSRQVLKRIVDTSMCGPFTVDDTTSATKEIAEISNKDCDELR
ncbi:hypothetical protein ACK32R_04140 [Aeromonas dhakensis]|jgi:hypothetical protein|uniref:hypothetical protein n=1 Tax=Aeromonas dhakensis TaxID=196024 RepID=UPI0039888DE9